MAKHDKAVVNQAMELFIAGVPLRRISAETGMPFGSISWHVDQRGLPRRKKVGRKRKYEGLSEAEVTRLGNLRKYGLALEDYAKMLVEQGGVCAICRLPPKGGKASNACLNVDHDHKTGRVRGLLCAACNLAIGKLKDSPALLREAAAYLER